MIPTPTPWSIYDDGLEGSDIIMASKELKNGPESYDVAIISEDLPPLERKANAAYIVKCVNAHEALVKATQWALKFMESPIDGEHEKNHVMTILRQALTLAGEGGAS